MNQHTRLAHKASQTSVAYHHLLLKSYKMQTKPDEYCAKHTQCAITHCACGHHQSSVSVQAFQFQSMVEDC